VARLPPGGELRKYWDEVNAQLLSELASLPEDEWLQRHKAMSEEDYAKDPTRNRLGVLLSRTNHMSYHLWPTQQENEDRENNERIRAIKS
jgi:hypothetical protein